MFLESFTQLSFLLDFPYGRGRTDITTLCLVYLDFDMKIYRATAFRRKPVWHARGSIQAVEEIPVN